MNLTLETTHFGLLKSFLASKSMVGVKLIERIGQKLIAAIHQMRRKRNTLLVPVPVVVKGRRSGEVAVHVVLLRQGEQALCSLDIFCLWVGQ